MNQEESLTYKVARNTIIQFAGKTIATLLAVVIASLMMRYLGPEGFGEYTIIITFLVIFFSLAELGLRVTLAREIARPQAEVDKVVSNVFTLELVFGLGILLCAPALALFFPYSELVKKGILIAAFSYLCLLLIQVLGGIFQKQFCMEKIAIGEVTAKAVWLLGVIACIKFNLSLLFILTFAVLANFINLVMVFLFAQRYTKIRLAFDFLEWKRLLKIAYPLAIMAALTLLYYRVNVILLSLLRSEAEVGIYGAASKIIEFLITFPAIFAGLLLPVLSQTIFLNKEKFCKVYQKGFNVLAIICLPLVFGTQFFAEPIILFLGGKEFIAAAAVLRILIFACGFIFFAHLFFSAVVAANQQRKAAWFYGLAALISIVGNLIFIPYFSYYATAIVSVISEAIICLSCAWIVAWTIKVRPQFGIFLKSLVASLVMSGVVYLLKWHFLISLVLAIIVYFVVLYLLRGFSKKTVKEIIRLR